MGKLHRDTFLHFHRMRLRFEGWQAAPVAWTERQGYLGRVTCCRACGGKGCRHCWSTGAGCVYRPVRMAVGTVQWPAGVTFAGRYGGWEWPSACAACGEVGAAWVPVVREDGPVGMWVCADCAAWLGVVAPAETLRLVITKQERKTLGYMGAHVGVRRFAFVAGRVGATKLPRPTPQAASLFRVLSAPAPRPALPAPLAEAAVRGLTREGVLAALRAWAPELPVWDVLIQGTAAIAEVTIAVDDEDRTAYRLRVVRRGGASLFVTRAVRYDSGGTGYRQSRLARNPALVDPARALEAFLPALREDFRRPAEPDA